MTGRKRTAGSTPPSSKDHQRRTTRHHGKLLDMYDDSSLNSEPVAVLQGRSPHQYLTHLDSLQTEGVLTRYVAIGSLSNRDAETVAQIIHNVRDALPSRHRIHTFGVKTDVLQLPRVVQALDSADSMAYDFRTRMQEPQQTWRRQVYHYLSMKQRIEEYIQELGDQQSLLQSL